MQEIVSPSPNELGYAGQFLREYEANPPRNIHRVINSLTTRPKAFQVVGSALITKEVQFPDVSFYQGEIDFDQMAQNTKAIIIRAGQNLWRDEQFERNYAEAKRRGLLVGVYWFYDDRVSPGAQADLLRSLLEGKTLEMEVFIDWERSYGGSHRGLSNVVAMMERLESFNLNIKDVGLYTGYYFFRGNSNAVANASQYNYLRNKPLWLAWYTTNSANVLIPAPWSKLTHWQWGTPAVQWGQRSVEIDMNFYNGPVEEFNDRYEGTEGNDGGEGGEEMQIIKGTVTAQAVKIRKSPGGAEFVPPRYLIQGDEIEASEHQYQWLHLTKVNGVAVSGEQWSSAGSLGQYIDWGWVTVEEPTEPEPEEPTIVRVHSIDIYSNGKVSIDGGPLI